MALIITNTNAKAALDAIADSCEGGTPPAVLKIYANDGTPTVPVYPDDGVGGATLLSEHTMTNPAFDSADDALPGAIVTAAAIADDSSCNATGTAKFFQIETGTAGTVLIQGELATDSSKELNFNSLSFVIGTTIQINSFTMTMPEGP